MVKWDPAQYLSRADERGRPFLDLVDRIGAGHPRRVVDLGCGPGNQTALLTERWPDATILGIDSSVDMIALATSSTEAAASSGRLSFAVGDIASWQPDDETDVVISNAALQWVPTHRELITAWAAALPSGAWMAFQVPSNLDAPAYRRMRQLGESPRWSARLSGKVLRDFDRVDDAVGYATLLLDCGWVPDVWETTYAHLLTGDDAVLDWVRGTALRPVLAELSPTEATEFESEYAEMLRASYPARSEGTLFPFRRVFCVAHKPC